MIKTMTYLDKDKNILCSVSGGGDSDIVVDILYQCGFIDCVKFVFFDTGLEYEATKEHLNYLEKKYNISIERFKPSKSIPTCCKEYGLPFISKRVSEMLSRLQKHGFQFEDEDCETLIEKYPRYKCAIRWWCNDYKSSALCISRNKYLKEFIIENPPDFKIANMCCEYAKKKIAHNCHKVYKTDIDIIGVRKAEGGVRASVYKSCFEKTRGIPQFRPVFWYTNADKEEYCEKYGVIHSRCYTEYGMKRTGCCGCPFDLNLGETLKTIEKYEPKLYAVAWNVFGKSYEYTMKYREYVKERKKKL